METEPLDISYTTYASRVFDVKYYRDLEMWVRGHSRSLKVVPFESMGAVFLCAFHSNYRRSLSVAILEIFSVKEWHDLEIWVWGPSRSLKMARFDRQCVTSVATTFLPDMHRLSQDEFFNRMALQLIEHCRFPGARKRRERRVVV